MRYFWISLLALPMMLFAMSATAQWEGPGIVDEQEDAFQDRIERNEDTKAQVESTEVHVAPHPGPEGGPGEAEQLLRDRLQVLQEQKSTAVQQKKTPQEIASIDAEIKSIQQQLTAY